MLFSFNFWLVSQVVYDTYSPQYRYLHVPQNVGREVDNLAGTYVQKMSLKTIYLPNNDVTLIIANKQGVKQCYYHNTWAKVNAVY